MISGPFETSTPEMIPTTTNSGVSSSNYRIRCIVCNLTDIGETAILEDILTKGLDGKEIVILEKDKYSFQNNYFMVVTYLEKR